MPASTALSRYERGRTNARHYHPLNAVLWLAQDLEKSRMRLKPGDVLSLGSFTAPLTPRPGLIVTVRYEGLPGDPTVSVRFK
jgi:2-keto-4-pentenoate hydratase